MLIRRGSDVLLIHKPMQPVYASLWHYNNKACIVISVRTYRLHN